MLLSGLDPAGPLFTNASTNGRLDASDAEYVDAIHTAVGTFGFVEPCGTVDFFVNGGLAPQPGCIGELVDIGQGCGVRAENNDCAEDCSRTNGVNERSIRSLKLIINQFS